MKAPTQAEVFFRAVAAVCRRHGIAVEIDAEGNPIPNLEHFIRLGFLFLWTQPEFQPARRRRGRPKGTVRKSDEDIRVIKIAREVAHKTGMPFKIALGEAARMAEERGDLPFLDDRGATLKRLKRLDGVLNDRAAKNRAAIVDALLDKK